MQENKARKPYPTLEERLVLVERKIAHLTQLNTEREELVRRTEALLNERKSALDKSRDELKKALARKERLESQKAGTKKAASRTDKLEEKRRMDELLSVIKARGLSLEDVMASLNNI